MVTVEATIVGGGITGCAAADAAARAGFEVVLLEKEAHLASGVTSRNSEVSHGGMYYPPGSIKADCCVRGRRLLKAFCDEVGVPYNECGKLIVAVDDDEADGLDPLTRRWASVAHPPGTRLTVQPPGEERIEGAFAGLTPDGALSLRLADGSTRAIHAGDVMLANEES